MSAVNKYIRYGTCSFSKQKVLIKLHAHYCKTTGTKSSLFQDSRNSFYELVSRNISTQRVKLQSINLCDVGNKDDGSDDKDKKNLEAELKKEDVASVRNSVDMSTFHQRLMFSSNLVKHQSTNKKISGPMLTNLEAATSIVTQIMDSRSVRCAPILEINCGPGVLTKTFLENGVSTVVGANELEDKNNFSPFLRDLQNHFGDNRFQFDYCNRWQDGNKVLKKVVKDLQLASASYEKNLSVVILAPSVSYRNQLANFCIYKIKNDLFYSKKDIDFYLIFDDMTMFDLRNVNHELYKTHTYHRNYQILILHMFFDITPLGKYPRQLFSSIKIRRNVHKRFIRYDPDVIHLVRLRLKADHASMVPPGQYWALVQMVRLISRKGARRIIPLMEDLVPNCGLRLLAEGFDMTEAVNDLEPSRFIEMYKLLVSFPEFRNSPLQHFFESKRTPGESVIPIVGKVREEQVVDLEEEVSDDDDDDIRLRSTEVNRIAGDRFVPIVEVGVEGVDLQEEVGDVDDDDSGDDCDGDDDDDDDEILDIEPESEEEILKMRRKF